MSYTAARKCFKENVQVVAGKNNYLDHNLNTGLFQLAQAIESQLNDLKQHIDQIEHDVRQLKNR